MRKFVIFTGTVLLVFGSGLSVFAEVDEGDEATLDTLESLDTSSVGEDIPDPDDYELSGPVVEEDDAFEGRVLRNTGDTSDNEPLSGDSIPGEPKDGDTVLPGTDLTTGRCQQIMIEVANLTDELRKQIFERLGDSVATTTDYELTSRNVLGCAIKTGNVKLWMIPYYIRFILEFLIGIAGLVAVGGFVYGGFIYLFAGLSEDKDKGKKALFYSVAGLIMVLVAWAVVNIVIAVVTA